MKNLSRGSCVWFFFSILVSLETNFLMANGDTAEFNINKIILYGNKVTKRHIILRELLFTEGAAIQPDKLYKSIEQSRRNLLNTLLFNFVSIDTTHISPQKIDVIINVVERWYTWPVPVLELADRNFNVWWKTKDFSRTNYGVYLTRNNFRGRKEKLIANLGFGYDQNFRFEYSVPYLNKKQRSGISFAVSETRNHEVNYKTFMSEQQFFKNPDEYVRKYFNIHAKYTYRQGFYNSHSFVLGYSKSSIHDTIRSLNPNYFRQGQTSIEYFTLSYYFKRDYRSFKAYPLTGYFVDFEMVKIGIGIPEGAKTDMFYALMSARKYLQLGNKFYFAGGLRAKISNNAAQPYFLQKGLGYGHFVRGYEYYVIDGQHYGLLKANLKYALVAEKVKKFNFIPSDKFNTVYYAVYMNIFGDAGYVTNIQTSVDSPLSNILLPGAGIGLDFVTYYDSVLRLEYSVNKFGESGIFIHFTASI